MSEAEIDSLIEIDAGVPADGGDAPQSAAIREAAVIELIELLFFAYRDFVSDPDEILKEFGFGRAHHRVIHFVGRNPGIRVSELLTILRITKQSLGRVLRQLVEQGFIDQREGTSDRRQRLLFLTTRGRELMIRLMRPQIERVRAALERNGPEAQAHYRAVLYSLVDADDRARVAALISKGQKP